jgi:hypothetical protein
LVATFAHDRGHQAAGQARQIRLSPRRKPETSASSSSKTANLPGSLRRGTESEPRDSRPTLADVGIDKKLSARSQKVGGIGEASAFQNGIYTVTTAGSGSAPWVLTRASC